MFMIKVTGFFRGWVIGALLMIATTTFAAGKEKKNDSHRNISLYLTHGFSSVYNAQLGRLGVGADVSFFTVAAGAGFHLPSGIGIDLEMLALGDTHYSHIRKGEASSFQQERFSVGGSYRYFLNRNFALFPEAGVSYNKVRVGLEDGEWRLGDKTNAFGWYIGAGVVIPIKHVFFDIRLKSNMVDLAMDDLGVNSRMDQLTFMVGFGFTI